MNKQRTLAKFVGYKIAPGAHIIHSYQKLQRLGRSLNLRGVAMDDTMITTKIIECLPDEFIPFKKGWDSVPDANQTMPNSQKKRIS